MVRGGTLEDEITVLKIRLDGLEKIMYDIRDRNKEILAENRKLYEPIRKLKMESKAMNAKANNAKKLLKTLQEVNEINSTDT
jgi:hypothetical protein